MERKLKIYLDTSVINFLYADDAPEKKEVTIDFFDNYLDKYEAFISEYVIVEINRTESDEKREKLNNAIKKYKLRIYSQSNDTILEMANNYIEKGILPESKLDDALHIAFSTYFEFDILLSWNFKHLANINKQEKVNTVNSSLGYRKILLMLNPMEVVYE